MTTAATTHLPQSEGTPASRPERPVRRDVWSRAESRYRIRAALLLVLNVLLFAGVGSFTYWLRSGVYFAPAQSGYFDELTHTFWSVGIVGRRGVSLGDLLIEPINVQDVPMQIPVFGLLMAALISIPVLVAILYRFWACLPFIAVVGLLAVMPWLAVTLLGSCLLASARRFQTRYRFTSALLGLVPVGVYMILAWAGTNEAVITRIDPVDKIKFVAPWVMAIVASAVAFAVVLAVAKLVDYRPGAIAPLLAAMFILPVALFEVHVGRDELSYRLIRSAFDAWFRDVDASAELQRAVMDEWARQPSPRPSFAAVRQTVETRWVFGLLPAEVRSDQSALTRHQHELVRQCDAFLRYHPTSRYAPNVLFLKGRALDMRVDAEEFRRTKWIRFYDDFPHGAAASRPVWIQIHENWPDSPVGMVAMLRLAQIEARDGEIERAVSRLQSLLPRLDRHAAAAEGAARHASSFSDVLRRDAPQRGLHIRPEVILLEAHRLYDLLRSNHDPRYGYAPLCGRRAPDGGLPFGLLDLDPRDPGYTQMLEKLKAQYPGAVLEDNIELEIARSLDDPAARIQRLEELLASRADGDAVPEALYRLGAAYRDRWEPAHSEALFRRLRRAYPDSIWARQVTLHTTGRASTSHGEGPTERSGAG